MMEAEGANTKSLEEAPGEQQKNQSIHKHSNINNSVSTGSHRSHRLVKESPEEPGF